MSSTRKRNVHDVLEALELLDEKREPSTEERSKNILVRVDFNVPMAESENGKMKIVDDTRIRAALPTIELILSKGYNVIAMSHMGRPKKAKSQEELDKLSLKPVSSHLKSLLKNAEVNFCSDCIGEDVELAIKALPSSGGNVLLLENLRYHKEEEKNDEEFSRNLASLGQAFINDAFGTCHRAHASVAGITSFFDPRLCGVGCLVDSEVRYLDFSSETGNIVAVIGGAKVSTKLPIITSLLEKSNVLILGGALAFTFLKAQGIRIGNSLVEDSMIDTAKEILKSAEEKRKKILLPLDVVCAKYFPVEPFDPNDSRVFHLTIETGIDEGWSGFDVGPKSIEEFRNAAMNATKLVLNGKSIYIYIYI